MSYDNVVGLFDKKIDSFVENSAKRAAERHAKEKILFVYMREAFKAHPEDSVRRWQYFTDAVNRVPNDYGLLWTLFRPYIAEAIEALESEVREELEGRG